MAIYREIPKCTLCGKQIMKPIYRDMGNSFFGDTFSHYEEIKHICVPQIKLKIKKLFKIKNK